MGHAYRFSGYALFWWACLLLMLLAGPAAAEPTRNLTILTSFPPRFYTPFVEQFEHLYPSIQVSVLNKKTTAALDEIHRGNTRNLDIFWSSSADAFDLLKSEQALEKTAHRRDFPLLSINNIKLDDPDGFFYGFALSGVGWMWNNQYLRKEGLPIPQSWSDLTRPIYYGHLAMSTPARSGTTHMIVENFLQELGWEKGWQQLLLMSGNFATVTARSFSVPEGISSGRFGIGLVIDFLALARQSDNIRFRYGEPVFPVPASIARLQGGQDEREADLFMDFILSLDGQRILLQPDISRLPVAKELFPPAGARTSNLQELLGRQQVRAYAVTLSRQRYHLVNELFDRMITFKLRERRTLWRRLIALEKNWQREHQQLHSLKQEVIALLVALPVSAAQSRDPVFIARLGLDLSGDSSQPDHRATIHRWDAFIEQNLAQVKELLDQAESTSRQQADRP